MMSCDHSVTDSKVLFVYINPAQKLSCAFVSIEFFLVKRIEFCRFYKVQKATNICWILYHYVCAILR